jgi:hypothetical protein
MLAAGVAVAQQNQHGQHTQQQEAREPIRLPAMQRDMLLGEMRGLLTSVNGLLRGLAARDTALMRQSAASAGMAAMMRGEGMRTGRGAEHAGEGMRMGGEGRGMGARMPEGFRALMHGTRSAFDSLALRIAAGAPADTVVARVASITSSCVACHAAYRLEVSPP